MKKLKRFLAMMITVVLCAGAISETGFSVFAADDEVADEEAVAEESAEETEEVQPEEEAVPEDGFLTGDPEEDFPVGEPSDDGTVTKLVVNGINMLDNEGVPINAAGLVLSDTPKKGYMLYQDGTLILNGITLTKGERVINCEGDLNILIVGNCYIEPKGVTDAYCFGIWVNGNLGISNTSTGTELNKKRVPGLLGIKNAANDKAIWCGSIFSTGNLVLASSEEAGKRILEVTIHNKK